MNKLFILGAYVKAPLVRETRLVSDKTMPVRDWSWYDEPACDRNPGLVAHARDRAKKRRIVPKNLAFLKRQAS